MNERDDDLQGEDRPCYVISVAAKIVGMHAQTLRYYERAGLLKPSRSQGRIRLYSVADINRLRQIQRLINDLGVNLAGAEVIMRMNQRIQEMAEEMERLRGELQRLRDRRLPWRGRSSDNGQSPQQGHSHGGILGWPRRREVVCSQEATVVEGAGSRPGS